jgi:di/tricarboxylate transporter
MIICLAIFVFMIAGYVFADKLHTTIGVVALCAIVLTAFSGIVKPSEVIANFGNANAVLIVSMFVVVAGFNRTQAIKKLSSLVYKISGGNFRICLAGYVIMTFLLAQFIPSPIAVFTIVFPLVSAMCVECGVSPSKAMFSVGLTAVATAGSMPLGSGAVTFATENGYLESYGYTDFTMGILDPFKGRAIISAIVLIYTIFIAPKFAPDVPISSLKTADSGKKGGKEVPPLDPVHEILGYAIFALTTICLIFQSKLGLASWQITLAGAALVVATGVLKPQEAVNAMPIRILMLLVAALSVGGAMVSCGLGDLIGNAIAGALGGTKNGYIIGAAFYIIPFILTQVMQNQSVSNIFRPILILTCSALGCNPIGPLILLSASTLTAFMTPMATPLIPIMMEEGGYTTKDLLKMGWLPSIIISVVAIFWVMTIFPAY